MRIAVARDRAFHFYYPDTLEALERGGAELVPFSPIADSALPGAVGGLYLGGGYPEEHAAELSANRAMRDAVRSFAESGGPIYAECGGLMYLASELVTLDGARHPMCGVLPVSTRMLPRLRSLGYREVTLTDDSVWGRRGAVCRGHEFHYSELDATPAAGSGWKTVYSVRGEQAAQSSRKVFNAARFSQVTYTCTLRRGRKPCGDSSSRSKENDTMRRGWYFTMAAVLALMVVLVVLSARHPQGVGPRAPGGKQRIVSLAPSVTEILFALGLGDSVVGATEYCTYPPEAKKVERIGGFASPNIEKIISLSPDLVIGGKGAGGRCRDDPEGRGVRA